MQVDMPPYDALAVANEFLKRANRDGVSLTPMQLQKLVYIAHGWCLAIFDKPLIKDRIEAWDFGPVIPRLYHQFKRYGHKSIREYAAKMTTDGSLVYQSEPSIGNCPSYISDLLDKVWEVYGSKDGLALSVLTHQPDSPWTTMKAKYPRESSVRIPDELIKTHYVEKARRNEQRKERPT